LNPLLKTIVLMDKESFLGGVKLSINKIRSILYGTAKILGDVNAVKKGTIGKRIARRVVGKGTGKIMRKLFK
jgi:hypothetical protein